MVKIALLDDYQNVALKMADWSVLPGDAEVTVFNEYLGDGDAVAARLADFEIVGIMRERTPFPRALFEKLPNLKLLVTTGMRNASIDLAAAADHGVMVCGTRGLARNTVELTWALILAAARSLPFEDRRMREGGWQTTLGRDLEGATLGVIGLGRLGSQVATIGKAFGMNLLAWSQNLTGERAAEFDATLVSKDELLAQADFVTIHLVLSGRTRGLIGAAELARMKPDAYLINASRGPIVDEAALIAALEAKRIAGAGLDVYDIEPLPTDHPLRRLDNVVLSPHIGYVTGNTYRVFYGDMVEAIAGYLDGAPVRQLQA